MSPSGNRRDLKGYSMYEVLCERCWHTEPLDGKQSAKPDHRCPACGAERPWVGPFATAERFERRRESWPVLTSPLYIGAGRAERRLNPR
jgi:hypothetical protein